MPTSVGITPGMSAEKFITGLDKIAGKNSQNGDKQLSLVPSNNCLSSKQFFLKTATATGTSSNRLEGSIYDNRDQLKTLFSRLDITDEQSVKLERAIERHGETRLTVASLRDMIKTATYEPKTIPEKVQNLVDNAGVTLRAIVGDRNVLPNTTSTVNVEVEVNDGRLSDRRLDGYLPMRTGGETYAGDNVVEAGTEARGAPHIGTHSLVSCSPVIMIMKDSNGDVSTSLYHLASFGRDVLNERIDAYEKQGYTVEKIITGIHGTRHPRQISAAFACAEDARARNIDYSIIKYDDEGRSSWWVSAEVVNNTKVKINIGSDSDAPFR